MSLSGSIRDNAVRNGGSMREHDATCAIVEGADGLDLLHRISTNDLRNGPGARAVETVFTTEKGRIIAFVDVVVTPARTILCCSAETMGPLIAWIAKYTITEDIHIQPLSPSYAVIKAIGGNVHSLHTELEPLLAPEGRVGNVYWGPAVTIWPVPFGTIPGVRILAGPESVGRVEEALEACHLTWLEAEQAETIRILEGVPRWGREITHDRNPLEIGLRGAISFTKGCYIGQEVIARLDAYEKVQRELAGLEILAEGSPGAGEEAGWEVYAGDEAIGRVTSLSARLDDGSRRALALVRAGRLAAGARVTLRGGALVVPADVARLWPDGDRGKRDEGR